MTEINLSIESADELLLISAIADRAMKLPWPEGMEPERIHIMMDITATHLNGQPLRLADLLDSDDFNFAHDIAGIRKHLNRETGKLDGCFLPRFSAR